MNKKSIWGRELELEIIYDCYDGEKVLPIQKEAYNAFVMDGNEMNNSKEAVKKYCLEENKEEIGTDRIDNIFKYVMPESIFIKRDGRVALLCKYRYDMEHGIAVVFMDGKFIEVGSQDIIL